MSKNNYYSLLDCGDFEKVEIFGKHKLIRPCPQAAWTKFDSSLWSNYTAKYVKGKAKRGIWENIKGEEVFSSTESWVVESEDGIKWKISPNASGNVGIFTEHWLYGPSLVNFFKKGKVLNLFSYTGSNCLPLIKAGFEVTIVDSSKNAITGFNENMSLNGLNREGQRFILEDVLKFAAREIRRGKTYENILVDAPSFGHGNKGEVFDIERDFRELLQTCEALLSSGGGGR